MRFSIRHRHITIHCLFGSPKKSCSLRPNSAIVFFFFFFRSNFTPFVCKSFQIWDHFFSLFSSKNSKALKVLDIQLGEGEAKRHLNATSKSEQTDKHTHGRTNQLIESIGPEGRGFENVYTKETSIMTWPGLSAGPPENQRTPVHAMGMKQQGCLIQMKSYNIRAEAQKKSYSFDIIMLSCFHRYHKPLLLSRHH